MERVCKQCNKKFETNYKRQRLCSNICRKKFLYLERNKNSLQGTIIKCFRCQKQFKRKKYNTSKRSFCSISCRNKTWREENYQHLKEYQKKWRIFNSKVICRYCKGEVPLKKRKSGITFCSDDCRQRQRKISNQTAYDKKSERFQKFKEKIGCFICGYKKMGCCLDFHHKVPETKERRIGSKHWFSKSPLVKKEMKKCILVCKNCHYELHYWLRNDEKRYWKMIS